MARLKSIFRKSEKHTPGLTNNDVTPQTWAQPAPLQQHLRPPYPVEPSHPVEPSYPVEPMRQMRFKPMKRPPNPPQQPQGTFPARPNAPPKVVNVTSEDLYNLRELMRTKYMHDVDVWSMRKAVRANLKYREEAQRKSDQAMQEIRRRIADWDYDNTWEPEERRLVQDIQRRLGLLAGMDDGPGLRSSGGSSAMFEKVSMSDFKYA